MSDRTFGRMLPAGTITQMCGWQRWTRERVVQDPRSVSCACTIPTQVYTTVHKYSRLPRWIRCNYYVNFIKNLTIIDLELKSKENKEMMNLD